MPAKLLFTIICDDIRAEDNGKLILIGVYNGVINFRKTAAPQEQDGEMKYALPQLCILRRWSLDSVGVKVKTELVEPSGQKRPFPDTELPLQPESDSSQDIMRIVGIVLTRGKYKLITTVLGQASQEYEETFLVGEV
jgi:hypothetical protein